MFAGISSGPLPLLKVPRQAAYPYVVSVSIISSFFRRDTALPIRGSQLTLQDPRPNPTLEGTAGKRRFACLPVPRPLRGRAAPQLRR